MRKPWVFCTFLILAVLLQLSCRASATTPAVGWTATAVIVEPSATTQPVTRNPLLKQIKVLTQDAGRVSWSPDGSLIAFDRQGADGYFDVWTMQPEGSAQTCLTCGVNLLPSGNIGNPEWHPSGNYLVIQVQDTGLPLRGLEKVRQYASSPGIGMHNNLWIMSSDGIEYWQITHIESGWGALHPQFSHKGDKLLWSHIAKEGQSGQVIHLADFAIQDGQPALGEVAVIALEGLAFYETHGFSPDDRKIIFSAYPPGGYFYDMEIFTLDLETRTLNKLTDNDEWDEHAHFCPDGSRIIYASSEGVPQTKAANLLELMQSPVLLELWLMDADGSDKQRLTYINDPDAPEYVPDPIGAGFGDGSWHPDGMGFVVKLRPGRGIEWLALIEFLAACGGK